MDTNLADTVEITGLSAVLDEDAELPYLDLDLKCGDQAFRVAILAADGEWTVNVRDGRGKSVPGSGELYAAQSDAIVAALLICLQAGRTGLRGVW